CIYNELPFEINRSKDSDENLRLKYRYLDLRNPAVKNNIILRCQVVAALRQAMTAHGFLEITTPILTASSPEGARDYLVPARKHPGKFYALPQAPQQFKQLLMTSGFDRYFQIAPCFRDEDARGDRSPGEFYQLDMEMAFATQDDVFAVLEDVLPPIFARYGTYDVASEAPFRRIAFNDAMANYGSDKPDLRIDLTCKDVSALFADSTFEPLKGQTVKMIDVSDCTLTRKQIEKLLTDCEVQSGVKGYWFKVDEHGELAGGIAKFVAPVKDELAKVLTLKPNTLVLVSAGAYAVKSAGVQIKTFGPVCEGHMDKERYEFCWIVDFPMYEIGDESGELEFCHNPFSMPSGGLETLLKAERGEIDPLDIYANQYDLVCNGVELSSGAVRNHDPEIMIKAFELVRLGEEDVKKKFPAMYNAFCYGAPPHAGIAPGVDRMVMLLAGESSIREIIPFPMNKNAQDVMMGAPSEVTRKQLEELHIAVVGEAEE
ncbi:MAG: aspartate--tRNA ligase, partial [Oscillospiraceae bacterium]|nr:aspartate--tRNA ligase [Oscillospiraceae bacterium]